MRWSGLERKKSILSTLTKIGFPNKPLLWIQFNKHLLSISSLCSFVNETKMSLCSSEVLTTLWETHTRTHARTHTESSNGLDKIWENISEFLEDRSWRDFSRNIPCTCFCSILLSVMNNFVKIHKQALCLVHSVGQEEGKSALPL